MKKLYDATPSVSTAAAAEPTDSTSRGVASVTAFIGYAFLALF